MTSLDGINTNPGQWPHLPSNTPLQNSTVKKTDSGTASGSGNGMIQFKTDCVDHRAVSENMQQDSSHGALLDTDLHKELINFFSALLSSLLDLLKTDDKSMPQANENGTLPSSKNASLPAKISHDLATPDVISSPKQDASSPRPSSDVSIDAPQGMPPDLWKDCVEAGKKHGIDPYVLAAVAKKESNFGSDLEGASGGDDVMQVEPGTRQDYAEPFSQKTGREYNHGSQSDRVEMAAVILSSKGGDTENQLIKYNGGDNYQPGTLDSYGRPIQPAKYAEEVLEIASQWRENATQA